MSERESYRVQLARMRAASGVSSERVEIFAIHSELGELERVFTCNGCGCKIAVGPYWRQKDPETFLGVSCGCFERLGGRITEGACEALGQDGTGSAPVVVRDQT